MDTPRPYIRIALFLLGLGVVFGASAELGSVVAPVGTEETDSHGAAHAGGEGGHQPAGLGVAEGGYAVRFARTQFAQGEAGELRLTVEATGGGPVTWFDELHERRMHLIVVRRDGTEFRHLHPEMDAVGTWSVPVRFGAAGVYRAFADFSAGDDQHTLAGRPVGGLQPYLGAKGHLVALREGDLAFLHVHPGEEQGAASEIVEFTVAVPR
jgi:hypothetical protein